MKPQGNEGTNTENKNNQTPNSTDNQNNVEFLQRIGQTIVYAPIIALKLGTDLAGKVASGVFKFSGLEDYFNPTREFTISETRKHVLYLQRAAQKQLLLGTQRVQKQKMP